MTRQQLEQQLNTMRQQESRLQQQVEAITEQLLMTRGAVQVLDHLMNTWEGDETLSPSSDHSSEETADGPD